MDTNSNEAESLYSAIEDVGNTEEIPAMSSTEVEVLDLDALIGNNAKTTRPISSKPRRTFEEYVSTQKVYDVLKEPEDDEPMYTSPSLKPKNVKSKKRKSLNPFLPFLNITLNEQHATNFMDGHKSKLPTIFNMSTDDAKASAPITVLGDVTTTNTTVLTTPATTTNPTKLDKSATNSVAIPVKSDISNAETPDATTTSITAATTTNPTELDKSATSSEVMPLKSDISNVELPEAETKSSTSNTTSPASATVAATTTNETTTTNAAPIAASATNSIAKQTTAFKKSVMGTEHIPLSIASKAHKSLAIKGNKMQIHSLSKFRNCVLLSTTSSSTDGCKGIIKFLPRNSGREKTTGVKCSDSNSREAFGSKESEKVTEVDKSTVDKEVLYTNTENTAANIPLVGKRKYTDPTTMPILSYSYQKSLADYIRKAKEFHKRAKLCSIESSARIDNSEGCEGNMVSTDIDSVNPKDGNDNTNMECDDESNVAQCKDNENRQERATKMDVEETANSDSEINENVTATKTTEDIEKTKSVEATETIKNTKELVTTGSKEKVQPPLESNVSVVTLEKIKLAEDAEATKNVASTTSTDILTDLETAENTEAIKDMESNQSVDNMKAVKSIEDTKNGMPTKSAEGTDSQQDVKSVEETKNLNNIELVESLNNINDVESVEGSKNPMSFDLAESTNNDVESGESTKNVNGFESVEIFANLKDVVSTEGTINFESAESTDDLKEKESTVATTAGSANKDMESDEAAKNLKNIESVEISDNLKDVESGESSKILKDIESAEKSHNLKDVESAEGPETLEDIDSAEGTDNLKDMSSVENVDNSKNITTTADMGSQIDIESDLCTYEIFNNVSGISNASSNQQTQTKESTMKILKNIWELKEKVQQQAEEIMSLKAAMKFLNTTNILNKS